MYRPEQFAVAGRHFTRNGDWTPPALVQNIIKEREAGKANLTGMNTLGVSAREAQEARALTCGMIACVDDAIGRVLLVTLDRSGKRDDTVVIFTSDHGDHPRRSPPDDAQGRRAIPEHSSACRSSGRTRRQGRSSRPAPARSAGSTMDISARPFWIAPGSKPLASGIQSEEPVAGARWRTAVRDSVFIQYDGQHLVARHPRAAASAFAGRCPLSALGVPRHRLGRALRSQGRSGRIRQSLGCACARCGAGQDDRENCCSPRSSTSTASRCRPEGREGSYPSPVLEAGRNDRHRRLLRTAPVVGIEPRRLFAPTCPSVRSGTLRFGLELRPGLGRDLLVALRFKLLADIRIGVRDACAASVRRFSTAGGVPFLDQEQAEVHTLAVNSWIAELGKGVGTSGIEADRALAPVVARIRLELAGARHVRQRGVDLGEAEQANGRARAAPWPARRSR